MTNVLIVDDNETLCRSLQKLVGRMDMKADYRTTLAGGLEGGLSENYDIVFLDVNLPDGSGLDIIPQLREMDSPPEIIIITGYGDKDGAELAIKNGAWDYIEKSSSLQNIKLSLTRAVQYREQKKAKTHRVALKRDAIIGSSQKITACLNHAAQAASSDGPVLITGETGTGKEIFARAIHDNSPYAEGDFVVVDCAALPDHLVESTLFGHRKGAFTGAESDRDGLIKQADGGSLFLDEIGELSPDMQKKFLRVLQEKRFRPIGGSHEITSRFRLLSATNRDLTQMVEKKEFRRDLYYRIQTIRIELPPLRQRVDDIPSIVMAHINRACKYMEEHSHSMSPDFMDTLLAYPWPGNVRELLNTVDRVLAEAFDEPVLFPRHLPARIRASATRRKLDHDNGSGAGSGEDAGAGLLPMKTHIEEMKRRYLKDLMTRTRGEIPAACKISGLSRAYLYQLMKKYDIDI